MWKTRKKPYSRIAEPPETGARTKRGHHQQRVRIGSNFSAKIASLHTRKTGMAYLIHSCKYMWTVHWNKDLLTVMHEKIYFNVLILYSTHFDSVNTKILLYILGVQYMDRETLLIMLKARSFHSCMLPCIDKYSCRWIQGK